MRYMVYMIVRDCFCFQEVQYLCTKIIELCDEIIESKDSLTIQPAAVDVVTIRKRHEQEWVSHRGNSVECFCNASNITCLIIYIQGLQYDSSYYGLHTVSGVNLSSPAHQSGHLERGDEILQVNYQTVVCGIESFA